MDPRRIPGLRRLAIRFVGRISGWVDEGFPVAYASSFTISLPFHPPPSFPPLPDPLTHHQRGQYPRCRVSRSFQLGKTLVTAPPLRSPLPARPLRSPLPAPSVPLSPPPPFPSPRLRGEG